MADAATPQASALEQPRFWTLDRVADALGDGPRGPTALARIATDTRAIGAGDCFVALKGETFDAHDYLAEAVAKGAAALVVHDVTRVAGLGVPVYVVSDTTRALGQLARYRRRVWGRPVVGVVGTNGKTSTKELLRAALGSMLRVHATVGNYNNLVGVPLTLFALPDESDVAVIEMGTNQPGEVASLRAIVEPDIVVVTSIAEEHLEGLGDLEGVLREELSACEGTGVAVVPSAQPEVVEGARTRAGRTVSAGLDAGDLRAERWGIEPDGQGWIELEGTTIRVPLRGVHNLRNAMLAIAVAREAGVSLDAVARGFAAMPSPPMRVNFETHGRATVINDAYNSNPGSARAALELLEHAGAGRQRVAVLGTMLELGAQADRLHDEIARAALAAPIELVVGVGSFAEALARVAPGERRVAVGADPASAWEAVRSRLDLDAVILLKGSRGVRLERFVPLISEWSSAGR
ncbi:MAG TPA: UDP-N-acetylmuramoyl-tripeptide--D-alanyl-D-alanine ligase [Gemmatimonadaceae bacterium]|jgi:UDP-N-acetylmuramoyl-tripeptide--D-alanyl-D-alanine ligase|nr:UDP-N-acetylmuramoyl-tripeptide--D-alanyl-D-alanine ligase [Gemmatimonadaceae bacterium]